jgi:hypothetical protein
VADIDFVITANHAENQNGLLYLSGGGWSDHHRQMALGQPPPISTIGVAVGLVIPWNETNQLEQLTVAIEDADGKVLAQLGAGLTTGRPPDLPQGAEQRVLLALNFQLQFPSAGDHRIVARLGEQVRSVPFRVRDLQVMQAPAA